MSRVDTGALGRLVRVAAVGLLVALSSCSGVDVARPDPADARSYVVEHLRARLASMSRTPPWHRDLAELLPNTRYHPPGASEPVLMTTAVVLGVVDEVERGLGFVPVPEGAPRPPDGDGVPTDFDDPEALWATIHLTVEVDDVVASTGQVPERVRVGLAVDGSAEFDLVATGLESLGTVVLFLNRGSAVFAYDPSLYAVFHGGGYIATVDAAGRLALPMLEPDEAARMLAGTDHLDDLLRAADQPPRSIPLAIEGTTVVRP